MKKDSSLYNDDLDFIELLTTIFNSKIKIVVITIFTILIGIGYNSLIPEYFISSLIVKPNKNSEFLRIESLNKKLNANKTILTEKKGIIPLEKIILDDFIYELMDYEELISVLEDNQKIREIISKLSIDEKKKQLYNYAKSLSISSKDYPDYVLNFRWNNLEEAKNILDQTINLTLVNFEKSIIKELKDRLEIEKKTALNNDLDRSNYLMEQSKIARELNIENNQVDSINLSQSNNRLRIDTEDVAYYLRGYKSIEKEIELIEKRKYIKFIILEKEIANLKEMNIDWIDYNFYSIDVRSSKTTKFTLLVTILIGITLGIFYALISNAFKIRKNQEKETN